MSKMIEFNGEISAASNIGLKRKNNEDIAFYAKSQYGILLCVADGMGGHRKGEVASKIVVDSLSVPFSLSRSVFSVLKAKHFLIHHSKEANEEIYRYSLSDVEYREMGTTESAALVTKNGTVVFSVGDSRVYSYSKQDGLNQITRDQSYVEMLFETGRINKMEMRQHPQRNLLTNAVGLNNVLTNYETYVLPNESYDALFLCTDGLYNLVSDETIQQILSSENLTCQQKVETLIQKALENGGNDNVAVVILEK